MPRLPIPAEGFKIISGHRSPPKAMGSELWCQLRNGWVDSMPWPVSTTRWKWELDDEGRVVEHPGDVVAIRQVGDA